MLKFNVSNYANFGFIEFFRETILFASTLYFRLKISQITMILKRSCLSFIQKILFLVDFTKKIAKWMIVVRNSDSNFELKLALEHGPVFRLFVFPIQ